MRTLLLLFLLFFLDSCTMPATNAPYNLEQPNETFILPKKLNEVSGLSMIDDSTIVAVQDERSLLFYIDTFTGKVIAQEDFGKNSDYEGITHIEKTFYILKSNGTIVKYHPNKKDKKYHFKHNKNFDFEGLCADVPNKRLLVACKEPGKKKDKEYIIIYAFSLRTKKYQTEPLYKIDKSKIHKKFKPSGIAIHPDGSIYILSSVSQNLLILSDQGPVKTFKNLSLPDKHFHQPEGITFNSYGDLYISNEKRNRKPTLLRFEMNF